MKNKKITNFERVLYDLPIEELKAYLKEYDKRNNCDIQKSLNTVSLSELQNKVESVGLQPTCPCCGSLKAKKKGLRGDTQRYLCLDCNKSYTLFSNTFVEGSTFSWDTWVKLLQLTIEGKSIDKTLETFTDTFDKHIEGAATDYICTDGNPVYKDYCYLKGYNHYVRPSAFLKTSKTMGISLGCQKTLCKRIGSWKNSTLTTKALWKIFIKMVFWITLALANVYPSKSSTPLKRLLG